MKPIAMWVDNELVQTAWLKWGRDNFVHLSGRAWGKLGRMYQLPFAAEDKVQTSKEDV